MQWSCTFDVRQSGPPSRAAVEYINPPITDEFEVDADYRWTWRFMIEAETYQAATRRAWERFSAQRLPHWAVPNWSKIEMDAVPVE